MQADMNDKIFGDSKVKTFMVEEAGSSMYPMLMKKIKFTAKKLGVNVPDRYVLLQVSPEVPHCVFDSVITNPT